MREREREMALPARMSLRPGLLWITVNLALIIQCLSQNDIYILFFKFYIRSKTFSRTAGGICTTYVEEWESR
jgi:hypothetical protein